MSQDQLYQSAESEQKQKLLEQQFEHADDLVRQRRFAEALAEFEACFAVMDVLFIEQLARILLRIGFCHADLQDWPQALASYHRLERILKQEDEWYRELPQDIRIGVPDKFDPTPLLLNLYGSTGLAYENSGQMDQAIVYYDNAIAGYMERDDKIAAANVWSYRAVGCQRRQEWAMLQQAAENMAELLAETDDLNGKIKAWQFLMQAHANQRQLDKTLPLLNLLVAAEEQIGHPDLERDRGLRDQLAAMMSNDESAQSELAPDNPAPYLARGRQYILQQRWSDALVEFTKAVEVAPDNVIARLGRSNAFLRQERFDEAISEVEVVLEHEPDNGAAYLARGMIYDQRQWWPEALADYNRAIELDSTVAQTYNNRGVIHKILLHHDEALADYRKAVELKPDHAKAHFNLANALRERSDYKQALQHFDLAARLGMEIAAQQADELRAELASAAQPELLTALRRLLQRFARRQK